MTNPCFWNRVLVFAAFLAFSAGEVFLFSAPAGLADERASEDPNATCSKALVQKAIERVKMRQECKAHIEAGDQAVASGLRGKAAKEYTAAWNLFPDADHAEVGIKAAALWGELNEIALRDRRSRRVFFVSCLRSKRSVYAKRT